MAKGIKITTIILISIIMTIVLVSLVNVGFAIFLERPDLNDFCEDVVCLDGNDGIRSPCPLDCNKEGFDEALKSFNQLKFYIFAGIGFVLLVIGLFIPNLTLLIIALASGGILVGEGIVFNLQNKILVFISLALILLIGGFLAVRKIRKL